MAARARAQRRSSRRRALGRSPLRCTDLRRFRAPTPHAKFRRRAPPAHLHGKFRARRRPVRNDDGAADAGGAGPPGRGGRHGGRGRAGAHGGVAGRHKDPGAAAGRARRAARRGRGARLGGGLRGGALLLRAAAAASRVWRCGGRGERVRACTRGATRPDACCRYPPRAVPDSGGLPRGAGAPARGAHLAAGPRRQPRVQRRWYDHADAHSTAAHGRTRQNMRARLAGCCPLARQLARARHVRAVCGALRAGADAHARPRVQPRRTRRSRRMATARRAPRATRSLAVRALLARGAPQRLAERVCTPPDACARCAARRRAACFFFYACAKP
jgi:hypothetical protein